MGKFALLVAVAAAWFGAAAHAQPMRIVSLDSCADQYVLGLADRAQIAGLSNRADDDDSYFRARAKGLRLTRATLEEALALKPDLIVRNWGGGPQAQAIYARFGVPVLQVEDAASFAQARAEMLKAASAMGHPARGEAIAQNLDNRLDALKRAAITPAPSVLYLTAGGATAGKGVLLDDIITSVGARNAYTGDGWNVLPLEQLVQRPPAYVALSFFDSAQVRNSAWSPSRHSGWRRALRGAHIVHMPAAATVCSGWFSLDAAEALSRGLRTQKQVLR